MNGLALCPGVGGLELGLELAFPAYRGVCYVEREGFVAGVLAARMQDGDLATAPIWDDVTTFDGRAWRGRVDCISAGFPCQPFSQAGKRDSTSDPRYLWDDIARIIGEVEPSIVCLENVRGLLSARFVPDDDDTRGEVFGRVLADLAALGYVGAWRCLRAADVGAPHRRDRVFIIAVAPDALDWARDQCGGSGGTGGEAPSWARTDGDGGSLADADRERRDQGDGLDHEEAGRAEPDSGGADADLWGRGPWSTWEVEPDVGRVVDGVAAGLDLARSSRRPRLRATGNGCVPQQAALAYMSLIGALLSSNVKGM